MMLAELYRTPPSQILRLEDPYEAWCLDEAVADYTLRVKAGAVPATERAGEKPGNNLELIRKIKAAQRRM